MKNMSWVEDIRICFGNAIIGGELIDIWGIE